MHPRAIQPDLALPGQTPTTDGKVAPPTHSIKTATLADLRYIDSLQKKFSNEVGFLPHAAIIWLIEQRRITLALENDEPCGYIAGRTHYAAHPDLRPITQAAVQYDAQRRSHGLELLKHAESEARKASQIGLQACCREGLEANSFWREAGFIPICILTPENKRKKEVIVWRKPLVNRLPVWFAMPPRRAGYRAFIAKSARNTQKDYNDLRSIVRPRHAAKQPSKTEENPKAATRETRI